MQTLGAALFRAGLVARMPAEAARHQPYPEPEPTGSAVAPFHGCAHKRRFLIEQDAHAFGLAHRGRLFVYGCACGGWHLTSHERKRRRSGVRHARTTHHRPVSRERALRGGGPSIADPALWGSLGTPAESRETDPH